MPFEQIDEGDHVVSIEEDTQFRIPLESVQVVSKWLSRLNGFLFRNLIGDERWINEGMTAKFLKLGSSQWIKGKVRIRVVIEFCPDEPEPSPPSGLEEFRQ
ncbi:KGK domain-containing protein [Microcoleus sp. FACHB-68]|uniref:KGK domain-containing protein n=1 Tax=Microcoleus sp. FACHB-68 TaxID=2692826 RepID=UPI0018F01311|nr:KGK domain-containing protein [Microcoleus sp. FACHB-68]